MNLAVLRVAEVSVLLGYYTVPTADLTLTPHNIPEHLYVHSTGNPNPITY
jgi:hypothetical protein